MSRSNGRSDLQRSPASEHRGANAQPASALDALGAWPAKLGIRSSRGLERSGTHFNNSAV